MKNNGFNNFIKWAGGKRRLLPHLKKYMPREYNRYYEPFFGGGALFFSELPKHAFLSDTNEELINCYEQVSKNPFEIIEYIKTMEYNKEHYYRIRSWKPKENIEIIPFKILSGKMKEAVTNYIIDNHTTSIQYTGRNNVTYTKDCIPKKKDIFLSDILQVYIPDNDIYFDLIRKKRFFKIADNGTKDFYVYEENISKCEICGRSLKKLGILCNDCGAISHNKRFLSFISHGFYCKNCGKSICRSCANYFSKFLFLKVIICNKCAKVELENGRTIKKFNTLTKV